MRGAPTELGEPAHAWLRRHFVRHRARSEARGLRDRSTDWAARGSLLPRICSTRALSTGRLAYDVRRRVPEVPWLGSNRARPTNPVSSCRLRAAIQHRCFDGLGHFDPRLPSLRCGERDGFAIGSPRPKATMSGRGSTLPSQTFWARSHAFAIRGDVCC